MGRKKHFVPERDERGRSKYEESTNFQWKGGKLTADHALCHRLALGESAIRSEEEWDKIPVEERCLACEHIMRQTRDWRKREAEYEEKRKRDQELYEEQRRASEFRSDWQDAEAWLGKVKTQHIKEHDRRYFIIDGKLYLQESRAVWMREMPIFEDNHRIAGYY